MLKKFTEPSFSLVDDGTLDTVIVCDNCGKETRFTYDNNSRDEYGDFIEWCIEELKNDHECEEE